MVAQQSRAKKGKAGNGRKSMSQSIARNNNTATQDDENISINLILAILSTGIMAFIGILTETLTSGPNHIPNHVDISWRSCF